MIIWLASYPKSGNTFLRSLLSAYIFTKDGNFNLNSLKEIDQFPDLNIFKKFGIDTSNEVELIKNYISVQQKMNSLGGKKIRFLKTHTSFYDINGHKFTDLNNTLGVIYIVRDPRNVLTSLINHYSLNNQLEAKKFLFEEKNWLGFKKENNKIQLTRFPTLISSWKTNYNSWKNTSKNLLLIKYENLISNPELEFSKLTNYLENIINIKFDKNKIENAINSTSFETLKNKELKEGFIEGAKDKTNDGKKRFFNLGPENNWKNLVKKEIVDEVEKNFEIEMKELNYL